MLDSLDYKIIELLTTTGRMTWADLSSILGLSAPSAADRVKRLEEKGVITGYSARINYQALGYTITAFVAVNLTHPKYIGSFIEAVNEISEIEECHHTAGDDDYLLKVRCNTTLHLDSLLNNKLKRIDGVSRTRTTIVLSSNKEKPLSKFDYKE